MDLSLTRNQAIAAGVAGAVVLATGGYLIGRSAAPAASESAVEGSAEKARGPAGFVPMTPDIATQAGIVVETIQVGGLANEILAQGVVTPTPAGEAALTARADGAIVRINRRLGDSVHAGEWVATIESREAAALTSERSTADARLTLARSTYERERRLYEAKVTARQDLEGARAALAEAEAEARRTRAAASASHVGGDGRTVAVVSLISGRITKMNATLGSYVSAGTELFRVADPTRIQVDASVLASDARRITPGTPAMLELLTGQVPAVVRSITPGLDPESKTATVVLQPDGSGSLTPGQGLRARIRVGGGNTGRIVLPEEAVQSVEGRDVVFVRTAKGFQAASVVTGQRSGGRIEVVEGLKPGVAVATRGAFVLKAELGKGDAEEE